MANIEVVTNEGFEQNVIQSKVPILVDFFADWCAPCKAQTPILDELATEFDGRIRFAKVDIDVDGNKDLATKYGVLSVPTLILLFKFLFACNANHSILYLTIAKKY